MTLTKLRAKHPRFIYQNFSWDHAGDQLKIKFQFLLEPNIPFTARLTIKPISKEMIDQLGQTELDNWVFHLGLIELFSYWKASAPGQIVIQAGSLNKAQLAWWRNLLIKGMGEFFYTNQIDFTKKNFVEFVSSPAKTVAKQTTSRRDGQDTKRGLINNLTGQPIKPTAKSNPSAAPFLVPVGGGKDSAVVIKLLEENNLPFDALLSYPQSPAAAQIAALSRATNIIKINRTFDPQLAKLNQAGYLNGHTPFSARLAFESSLVASLTGHQQVLLGNEFSANEGNVPFHGTTVNHQYSKTFEFETSFRQYVRSHLSSNAHPIPEYLSLLRPISELQIAAIFAQYPRYHHIFRSCNRNQQEGSWCGECAKCLFVFTILYPFLKEEQIIGPIFASNLFEDKSLNQLALALLGKDEHKPFECVGTYEETLAAFQLSLEHFRQQHPAKPLPAVLEFVKKEVLAKQANLTKLTNSALSFWHEEHHLSAQLAKLVRTAQERILSTNTGQLNHPTLQHLKNQSILILGLGVEGWSTYQFLRQQLPKLKLTLADQRPLDQFSDDQQAILKADLALTLLLGPNYLEKISKFKLIFKAPGIPQTLPEIKKALNKGAQLAGNTQLFFELCPGKIIGVTGTKGKSTTAAVIHHVLKTGGLKTLLLGNIGTPALSQLEQIDEDTLVVYELSSHQLETLTSSPYIAVIQDVTSEHLDYYPNTKAYQEAKTAIARWQKPTNLVIYNPQFEMAAKIASLSPGKHLRHSLKEGPETVAFVRQESLMYRRPGGQVVSVLPINQLPLLGQHNFHNVLPAIIVGHLFNLETETIGGALSTFKPLPHRLELVLEKNGVKYYDDSLSTIPFAAIRALESIAEPIVLIAGGHERDQDFTDLARVILDRKVMGLVLFNPTGARLKKVLQLVAKTSKSKLPPIKFAETMAEAVQQARQMVPNTSGVILMSPASASFGRFANYQDRGQQFQEAVKKLVD